MLRFELEFVLIPVLASFPFWPATVSGLRYYSAVLAKSVLGILCRMSLLLGCCCKILLVISCRVSAIFDYMSLSIQSHDAPSSSPLSSLLNIFLFLGFYYYCYCFCCMCVCVCFYLIISIFASGRRAIERVHSSFFSAFLYSLPEDVFARKHWYESEVSRARTHTQTQPNIHQPSLFHHPSYSFYSRKIVLILGRQNIAIRCYVVK